MLAEEANKAAYVKGGGPYLTSTLIGGMKSSLDGPKFEESGVSSLGSLSDNELSPVSHLPSSFKPLKRQFWSAGDYGDKGDRISASQSGQNRLRVHPKFLHSNATSHKWAFGAIAELLDNAVDEVGNGASFVYIDKITSPRDGNPALLIQDDGGGMDPESLRRCMSFGFSDKHCSSIGQYGNGFKTSTMRLGADVIVFSRYLSERSTLTQSVGLLSYTFLRQKGYDDIVVPMVDYKLNVSAGAFGRLFRQREKEFAVNLQTILAWSPFSTEEELLSNFDDIGHHGTKVIVFNLWYNDEGNMELDFDTDPEDIMIHGAHKPVQTNNSIKLLNQNHIAKRLRYSLRAYSSVLYLRPPPNFKIILRGRIVDHHYLADELKHCECIQYRPQVAGRVEAEVITVIGFLKDAPNVALHGFNIYHKNRLILPFCPVVNVAGSRGRGVSGVLEVNFIKPTHDKQGFEKSALYQKLETRLKDMTNEYWDYHAHMIGSCGKILPSIPSPCSAAFSHVEKSMATINTPCSTAGGVLATGSTAEQTGVLGKRRQVSHTATMEPFKKQVVNGRIEAGVRNHLSTELDQDDGKRLSQKDKIIIQMNKRLHAECLQHEQSVKELSLKAETLGRELEELQRLNKTMMEYLAAPGFLKVEKR